MSNILRSLHDPVWYENMSWGCGANWTVRFCKPSGHKIVGYLTWSGTMLHKFWTKACYTVCSFNNTFKIVLNIEYWVWKRLVYWSEPVLEPCIVQGNTQAKLKRCLKYPQNKETAWFVTVKVDLSHVGVRSRLVFEQLIESNVTST